MALLTTSIVISIILSWVDFFCLSSVNIKKLFYSHHSHGLSRFFCLTPPSPPPNNIINHIPAKPGISNSIYYIISHPISSLKAHLVTSNPIWQLLQIATPYTTATRCGVHGFNSDSVIHHRHPSHRHIHEDSCQPPASAAFSPIQLGICMPSVMLRDWW